MVVSRRRQHGALAYRSADNLSVRLDADNVPVVLQDKPSYTLAAALGHQEVAGRVHDDVPRLSETSREDAGPVTSAHLGLVAPGDART